MIRIFEIIAEDIENSDIKFLNYTVEEGISSKKWVNYLKKILKKGTKIIQDNNNDYQKIVDNLYFRDNSLFLKGYEIDISSQQINPEAETSFKSINSLDKSHYSRPYFKK